MFPKVALLAHNGTRTRPWWTAAQPRPLRL